MLGVSRATFHSMKQAKNSRRFAAKITSFSTLLEEPKMVYGSFLLVFSLLRYCIFIVSYCRP